MSKKKERRQHIPPGEGKEVKSEEKDAVSCA